MVAGVGVGWRLQDRVCGAAVREARCQTFLRRSGRHGVDTAVTAGAQSEPRPARASGWAAGLGVTLRSELACGHVRAGSGVILAVEAADLAVAEPVEDQRQ